MPDRSCFAPGTPQPAARSGKRAVWLARTIALAVGLGGFSALLALTMTAVVRLASNDAVRPPAVTAPPPTEASTLYPESGTEVAEIAIPSTEDPGTDASADATTPDDTGPAAPSAIAIVPFEQRALRLAKGDTVAKVLRRLGLAAEDVAEIVTTLAERVPLKSLPIGQLLTVTLRPVGESGEAPVLLALAIRPEPRRTIRLEREDDGDYSVDEEIIAVTSRVRRASARVDGSVIASAEAAGVPQGPLAEMLRAFSWDVNFQHDIKVGDSFDVLMERAWTADGQPVDDGRLLWAELTVGGGTRRYAIYRFKPRQGEEFFFNRGGESVVKALLRTPLNMSRISSRFGMRSHPLLGFTRLHAGIDFAAPPGTPILAAGEGHVTEAGFNGGYGRWVKINHEGGLATGYAHLSRIAPGVRRSARVRQGQVIGFVGSSGLSTGPHLHFELHRQGQPVDPLTMARSARRARLDGEDLVRFKARVVEIDEARETAPALESQ